MVINGRSRRSLGPFQDLGFRRIACAITSSGKSSGIPCLVDRDQGPALGAERIAKAVPTIRARGDPMRAFGPDCSASIQSSPSFWPVGCGSTGTPIPCPATPLSMGTSAPRLRCSCGKYPAPVAGSRRSRRIRRRLNSENPRPEPKVRPRGCGSPCRPRQGRKAPRITSTIGLYALRPAIPIGWQTRFAVP